MNERIYREFRGKPVHRIETCCEIKLDIKYQSAQFIIVHLHHIFNHFITIAINRNLQYFFIKNLVRLLIGMGN